MKTLHLVAAVYAIFLSHSVISSSALAAETGQSIQSLPLLSTMLIHHFECRLALLLNDPEEFKELNFELAPGLSGHTGQEATLELRGDTVTASVNSQALQIRWTRGTKLVASNLSMIRNSPSQARVLITNDPENEENRLDLSCNAILFSNFKGTAK